MVIVNINTNEYDMFGVYSFSIKTLKINLEILCKNFSKFKFKNYFYNSTFINNNLININ